MARAACSFSRKVGFVGGDGGKGLLDPFWRGLGCGLKLGVLDERERGVAVRKGRRRTAVKREEEEKA